MDQSQKGQARNLFGFHAVLARLRHGQSAAVLTRPCSPSTLAGIIAGADLVLGMRLHSVIFSLAASVPFVAIEYDPKVAAMTALTGFEEFTIPLGGIEADVLAGVRMNAVATKRWGYRGRRPPVVSDNPITISATR